MSYIITEKLTSTIVIYMILKRLLLPWNEWLAFKNGIIDKNGKRIRKPRTSKEREGWDILDRFCWSIKRLLTKYIGDNNLVYLFSTAYLMKEDLNVIVKHNIDKYKEELFDLTASKQMVIFNILNELQTQNVIRESHIDIETNVLKVFNQVEQIAQKYNLQSLFEEEVVATSMGDVAQFTPLLTQKPKIKCNKKTIQKRGRLLKRRKYKWQPSQEMKTITP